MEAESLDPLAVAEELVHIKGLQLVSTVTQSVQGPGPSGRKNLLDFPMDYAQHHTDSKGVDPVSLEDFYQT